MAPGPDGVGTGRPRSRVRLGSGIVCAVIVLLAAACGGGDGSGGAEAPPVGTVVTGVAPLTPATVSPDGRWLAYLDGLDTVCVLELVADAEPACATSELLGGDSLVWSDDSERVVTGFDTARVRSTRPLVVGRDGVSTERGSEVGPEDTTFQGSSAFDGTDVVYLRIESESDVAELVIDTADDEVVLAEVPIIEITLWPVVIDGDRALLSLGRGPEARVVAVDLDGGELTSLSGLEGLAVVENVGSTALAVDEQALTFGLDEPVFFIGDLADGRAPAPVVRDGRRARAAALSPDGERVAVVWGDPAGPDAVVAVASVGSVRSGDADWTDTTIDGFGPIADRHRRMRWTSASTVTMVVDRAVVTIDVGTQ